MKGDPTMLDEYVLSMRIKSQVVEKVFSEEEIVANLFNQLISNEQFTSYEEKLLTKILAVADEQGVVIDAEMQSNFSAIVIAILKISLYQKAVQELVNNGGGDLQTELCAQMTMKVVKESLQWLQTKTGVKQLLMLIKPE